MKSSDVREYRSVYVKNNKSIYLFQNITKTSHLFTIFFSFFNEIPVESTIMPGSLAKLYYFTF